MEGFIFFNGNGTDDVFFPSYTLALNIKIFKKDKITEIFYCLLLTRKYK